MTRFSNLIKSVKFANFNVLDFLVLSLNATYPEIVIQQFHISFLEDHKKILILLYLRAFLQISVLLMNFFHKRQRRLISYSSWILFLVFLFFLIILSQFFSGLYLGGASRDRTDDPRLAKPMLSQLSYGPSYFKDLRLLFYFCVRLTFRVLMYLPVHSASQSSSALN